MASFLEVVKTSQSDLVYLTRLKEEPSNKPAWYYVQIASKAKVPIFLEKIKTGINLNDYGTILYSGWGENPPEEIKAKIQEQFG